MAYINLLFSFLQVCWLASATPLVGRAIECSSLKAPDIPGLTITGFEARQLLNFTVPATPPLLPESISGLDICSVEVNLTHGIKSADHVRVLTWLPLTTWNHRFLGTGGSGFAPGLFEYALAPAVAQGFAAVSTDAGVGFNPYSPGEWALTNGKVNEALLRNFASISVHDMTEIGKALTSQFYGTDDFNSYWNGCSTGGRQGVQAAQEYPEDFDGILAAAPAINWPSYTVAGHWAQSVMLEDGYVSVCELNAFTQAAIAACDHIDGLIDGIITDPSLCDFDPFQVIGQDISCESVTNLTSTAARVVEQIWQGPSWWFGLNKGSSLEYLANSTIVYGTRTGLPFFVDDSWIKFYLNQDPKFNTTTINTDELRLLFHQSIKTYNGIIGASNPDLSRYHKAGGKLLMWHGLSDQLIFPQGTIRYVEEVARTTPNSDEFLRLFLAPGVDHCGGGTTPGPIPTTALAALIAWVEDGVVPDTLPVAVVSSSSNLTYPERTLCAYPAKQVFRASDKEGEKGVFECVLS